VAAAPTETITTNNYRACCFLLILSSHWTNPPLRCADIHSGIDPSFVTFHEFYHLIHPVVCSWRRNVPKELPPLLVSQSAASLHPHDLLLCKFSDRLYTTYLFCDSLRNDVCVPLGWKVKFCRSVEEIL